MKKDNHIHILLRYGVISAFILLFAAAIVYKLFDTTVIHSDDWNRKAMAEMQHVDTILPDRGDILAADGSILATNLRFYTVRLDFRSERFMEQRYIAAIDSLADSLALHFPIRSRDEWVKRLNEPLRKEHPKRPRAFALVGNISYTDLQLLRTFPFLNIKNPNKNGLTVESRLRRSNPYGDMARRSIGGVGQTAECREVHGISGLECALDSLLYGKPGIAKKIPLTRNIVNWTDVPPTAGFNIRTTIDIQMQDIVENELNRILDSCGAEWGTAVLMDVKTGDIKAISNLQKSKTGNGYVEALNYAVVGFEPGSVVKPISMMIALEDGLVNNVDSVLVTGHSWAYAGGRPISDSHGCGSMPVREVIERSSNVGMARIITRGFDHDPPSFVRRLESIGFFEPLNTGIYGETTPYFNRKPGKIDLSRMCYGYASKIPPLYTLAIYNAIANGGRFVRPRLYTELISEQFDTIFPVTYVRDRICSEENAAKMRMMLRNVVFGEHGTGRRLKDNRVEIAGKTGTCYSVNPATGQYDTSRKRLAFCGFFPADEPRYSCIVLTFWPKRNLMGAASTSGEVLKNIALKMYSRGMLGDTPDYRTDPDTSTRPQLYASARPGRHRNIARGLHFDKRPTKAPDPQAAERGHVPSVKGLDLREAIVTLENAGYNVDFRGTGYVHQQEPSAGTLLAAGNVIKITLSEK